VERKIWRKKHRNKGKKPSMVSREEEKKWICLPKEIRVFKASVGVPEPKVLPEDVQEEEEVSIRTDIVDLGGSELLCHPNLPVGN
jgi:hypothetical protein